MDDHPPAKGNVTGTQDVSRKIVIVSKVVLWGNGPFDSFRPFPDGAFPGMAESRMGRSVGQ